MNGRVLRVAAALEAAIVLRCRREHADPCTRRAPSRADRAEGLAEAVSSVADGPLLELVKTVKRSDHFLVAESETSTWTSSWPLLTEVKSARRGLLLQPDAIEGDTIMRTAFPRVKRADFPPGRGLFVHAGKVVTVQLPLV